MHKTEHVHIMPVMQYIWSLPWVFTIIIGASRRECTKARHPISKLKFYLTLPGPTYVLYLCFSGIDSMHACIVPLCMAIAAKFELTFER